MKKIRSGKMYPHRSGIRRITEIIKIRIRIAPIIGIICLRGLGSSDNKG
jgi:hypothetical protein